MFEKLSPSVKHARRGVSAALAFVAGGTNAVGLLALFAGEPAGLVQLLSYVGHSEQFGDVAFVIGVGIALLIFMCGAAVAGALTQRARRLHREPPYGLPLMVGAVCLLVFGLTGIRAEIPELWFAAADVLFLCFFNGLQNAVTREVSSDRAGVLAAIGLELGQLVSRSSSGANSERLKVHARTLGVFGAGVVAGIAGFEFVGFWVTVPLAGVLIGAGSA